jgi:hypothetical protein
VWTNIHLAITKDECYPALKAGHFNIIVHYKTATLFRSTNQSKGVKPSGDILSNIAAALGVSSDFLINGTTNEIADASLADKELLQQFKKAEQLNKEQKFILKELMDAYLLKCEIQKNFSAK